MTNDEKIRFHAILKSAIDALYRKLKKDGVSPADFLEYKKHYDLVLEKFVKDLELDKLD